MGRFTVEGSRSFACLKAWAALKIIGRQGYALLFGHARKSTDYLKQILDKSGDFETFSQPELFILAYRFIPKAVREQLNEWSNISSTHSKKEKSREAKQNIRKINHLVNGLNIKLHKALRMDDTTFVSRTVLESTQYRPNKIVVLRAVLINPLTNDHILDEILEIQKRIGLQIWQGFEPAYQKILEKLVNDSRVKSRAEM